LRRIAIIAPETQMHNNPITKSAPPQIV
jgi:hypothetical protein